MSDQKRTPPSRLRATARRALILATILALALPAALAPAAAVAQTVEVLHSFDGDSFSFGSKSLLAGQDGLLYGTTQYGGRSGHGTIFRMTPAGSVTILHSFGGSPDGSLPNPLIRASDGRLYGSTIYGGAFGHGTVFRMETDGSVVILHSFGSPGGAAYPDRILQAADGRLYGNSYDSIDSSGTVSYNSAVFRMTLDGGDVTTLHVFPDGLGGGNFIQASDGTFVGSSPFGMGDHGAVFRMALDGTVTVLHAFTGADGSRPWAEVIEATDGNFYGTTRWGGSFGGGTVFRMTPAGDVTVLYSFTGGTDGSDPIAPLVQAATGDLYGTASANRPYTGTGSVFKVASGGAFSVLRAFTGVNGSNPDAAIVEAQNGLFFGTTPNGGIAGRGVAFSIDTAGTVATVHEFNVAGPDARLSEGSAGQFSGATCGGGLHDNGELYRVSRTGQFSSLYSFLGSSDGACPKGVIRASDGLLYGTTAVGGPLGGGTAYRLAPDGTFTLLHAFGLGTDGSRPAGPLLQASDGNLYGTTQSGGASNLGTAFRITLSGAYAIVYSFAGGVNGASPTTGLFQGSDGMLYGLTGPVYAVHYGVLFRMTLSGLVTSVHVFGFNEFIPDAVVEGTDHHFYGVANRSIIGTPHQAAWCAVFFRVTPAGALTRLSSEYERCNSWYSGNPYAVPLYTLTARRDGTLIGTERLAQSTNLLAFDPGGSISLVRTLSTIEGSSVVAPLLDASDGNLYGVSKAGGKFSMGTAFRVRYTPTAPAALNVSAAGSSTTRLVWTPVAGATGYTIKRSSTSGAETLATGIQGTVYVDATAVRGRHYYYTVTPTNAYGDGDASYEVSITAGRASDGDFDGDGMADVTVVRPSLASTWYVRHSRTQDMAVLIWGESTDIPVPGDYDGDGVIDVAVLRPSPAGNTWYIRQSSTQTMVAILWGDSTDVPVPADYDGDAITDVAVFRPGAAGSTWYIRQSSTLTMVAIVWGNATDLPVPGDYDGDGRSDVAVFRPGVTASTWYIRQTTTLTMRTVTWGAGGDTPVAADYDGDGRMDVAVFRPSTGTWYLVQSATSTGAVILWGVATDMPVPGDFDGDGRADVAIFRPSTGEWFVRRSGTLTALTVVWGGGMDVPILKRP